MNNKILGTVDLNKKDIKEIIEPKYTEGREYVEFKLKEISLSERERFIKGKWNENITM